MCICIHMYICVFVYICIYMYISCKYVYIYVDTFFKCIYIYVLTHKLLANILMICRINVEFGDKTCEAFIECKASAFTTIH